MEPLIEISRNKWSQLQALYRNDWPWGIEGFRLLDIHIQYPDMNQAFNFKVYCPGGDLHNGMVAISDMEHYYQVYVYPVTRNITNIEHALTNTNIINWNRTICIPSVNSETLVCLKIICQRLSLQLSEEVVCKHLLKKESKPFEILNHPLNTYVAPLKPEYLDLIDRTWTYYTPNNSRRFFEILMRNGLSYVLYSTDNHKPLAWIFIGEAGAFTHLYCVATQRGKGYAEYITKIATNDLLRQGKDVLAYTLKENVRPQNLFRKLGFDFLDNVIYVDIQRI
ncbi:unnamed protein product [Diatraea saccharalis]|uniref:Glycine N-acyltransferase-like protein n=1 Tax=Diatraea saccharalis TaxID=40085 RepID=A0A9N9RF30_9NEOP|nr:unnamed protein product [Diatraea saccharalis]